MILAHHRGDARRIGSRSLDVGHILFRIQTELGQHQSAGAIRRRAEAENTDAFPLRSSGDLISGRDTSRYVNLLTNPASMMRSAPANFGADMLIAVIIAKSILPAISAFCDNVLSRYRGSTSRPFFIEDPSFLSDPEHRDVDRRRSEPRAQARRLRMTRRRTDKEENTGGDEQPANKVLQANWHRSSRSRHPRIE